jgi:hypothetical protein
MSDTPSNSSPQQVEASRFRSSVSEALLQSMQGNINYLLASVLPIGSVVHSLLTEAQFQAICGTGWVLCDGRNVAASDFAVLTGITNLPDARGRFLRGKNNGRAGATGNPDGELGLAASQDDMYASHTHGIASSNLVGSNGTLDTDEGSEKKNADPASAALSIDASGGNETRPRNITVNIFIRIN